MIYFSNISSSLLFIRIWSGLESIGCSGALSNLLLMCDCSLCMSWFIWYACSDDQMPVGRTVKRLNTSLEIGELKQLNPTFDKLSIYNRCRWQENRGEVRGGSIFVFFFFASYLFLKNWHFMLTKVVLHVNLFTFLLRLISILIKLTNQKTPEICIFYLFSQNKLIFHKEKNIPFKWFWWLFRLLNLTSYKILSDWTNKLFLLIIIFINLSFYFVFSFSQNMI